MKQVLLAIGVLFVMTASAQKTDTSNKGTSAPITIYIFDQSDTVRGKLYYESPDGKLKWDIGYAVEVVRRSSDPKDQPRLQGITYYDKHWNRFKYYVFNVNPLPKK